MPLADVSRIVGRTGGTRASIVFGWGRSTQARSVAGRNRRILVVEGAPGTPVGAPPTHPQSQDSSRGWRRPGGLKAGPAPVTP